MARRFAVVPLLFLVIVVVTFFAVSGAAARPLGGDVWKPAGEAVPGGDGVMAQLLRQICSGWWRGPRAVPTAQTVAARTDDRDLFEDSRGPGQMEKKRTRICSCISGVVTRGCQALYVQPLFRNINRFG